MITITSRGIPELSAWLKSLGNNVRQIATEAVAEYIVGDDSHGLKHEPGYTYVNRYAGFPNLSYTTSTGKVVPGYASAKQHAYVMMQIQRGVIKPGQDNRTHQLRDSWKYQAQGGTYKIQNPVSYAQYVQGGRQTRMHALIGWRQAFQVARDNLQGAYRHAEAKIKEWIATHKRS